MVETEYIISIIFAIVGLVIFLYGFKVMSKYRLINDTPRSKIRSMAMGLVELHGNVLADTCITTPFSQTDCVYYSYEIKEYRKHTSKGSDGKTTTSKSWDTISSGEKRIPFFAKDETGSVHVNPINADFNVDDKKIFLQKAGLFGMFGIIGNALKNWDSNNQSNLDIGTWGLIPVKKSNWSFNNRVGDRKYYERYIEPDANLFLLGTAANNPQASNDVFIHKGENEPTFIISDKSEKELVGSLKWKMIGSFVFGAIFFIIGVMISLSMMGIV
ncbi:MAG: GIDE domain-containing protein [Methanosarcinaceae archaeon]|nr:GIDE domain-containing protein [Methanosarcinaceae archaeon]